MMETNPLKRTWQSRWFRLGIGAAISLLFLWLAARDVDLSEVGQTIRGASIPLVAAALASVFANTYAKAARWRVILGPEGVHIPTGRLLWAVFAGQAVNNFVPGRFGDIGRAYVVGGMGPGRAFVLGTVVLEKSLELVIFGLLVGLLVLMLPVPSWIGDSVYTMMAIAGLVALGLMIITRRQEMISKILGRIVDGLPPRLSRPIKPRIRTALSGLGVLNAEGSLLRFALWSAVVVGTALLNNFLIMIALRIYLPVTAALLVLVALQLGITFSSIPGSIGVFEYLCVLSLSVFNIGQAVALGYGFLLHAVVLLPNVVFGGITLLVWSGQGGSVSQWRERGSALQDTGRGF